MFREIFYKKLQTGWRRQQDADDIKESLKVDCFRGGHSGCITEDGIILGADPREAVLRSQGIQIPTTMDDGLLFQAGHSNEDNLAQWMDSAGMNYLQEEDCPVQWSVTSGDTTFPVIGRPDFKVLDDTGKDQYGIELKGIFSVGTAMDVAHFLGANPKVINVCQSAHYSYKNNRLPWLLVYVNRGWHNVFYFGASRFKMDHRSLKLDDKTGKPITMSPFMTLYDLDWDGDTVLINNKPTLITGAGIDRYYQYLADCVVNKVIPSEHTSVDIWGKKLKKDKSKLYYSFKEASTDSWDQWVEDCKRIVEGI